MVVWVTEEALPDVTSRLHDLGLSDWCETHRVLEDGIVDLHVVAPAGSHPEDVLREIGAAALGAGEFGGIRGSWFLESDVT